jgi:predicted RND superfamily exporter protein
MNSPNKIVDRVDQAFFNIAQWSIAHRRFVAVFTFLLLIIGLFFAGRAQVDQSIDSFFYKDDASYLAYNQYLDDFTSDEVVYLMYSAESSEFGPFNIDVMRTIARLTETLALEVPFARKATSLANVEFMRSVGENDIEIDELLIDFPETQDQLLKVRDSVMAKPFYTNYLVSKDASHAAIIIQMEVSSADAVEKVTFDKSKGPAADNLYPQVSDKAIREILTRPEFSQSGIEYYNSGNIAMVTTYQEIMVNDTILITGIALLLILILCALLINPSFVGIIGPTTVVLVSVILTLGLIGFLSWKINNFFTLLPTLLCAVGIAQSVHILLEYQRQLALSGDQNLSIKNALHKVGGPCLMAAVTTAAGFAAMVVSDLRLIAEFAVYSAFGILATFVFSITLLVVFLGGKPSVQGGPKQVQKTSRLQLNPRISQLVDKCIELNLQHPKTVLTSFAVVFAIAFLGITRLHNDFSFLHEFKPHVEWRADTEKVEDEMGGTLRMSYLIDTERADGVKNPELLQHIEKIQQFAEKNPVVIKTLSLADIFKDLNQTFHSGDSNYFTLPDKNDLLAQYFLVYEMSGGEELNEFVSPDFSRTVIELQLQMTYASDVRNLMNDIDAYVQANPLPSNATGQATGFGLLWVKLTDYIAKTQIQSYALVFAMIAVFMCVSFGSVKVGMLSMIPNLTPVVFAMGALGWANMPLDYMKLLLATIAIGIAVDDTIHLVTRTRSRFFESGNYATALSQGLRDVGPALIITSCILVVAFSAYLLSNTTILSNFGLLLGGTISAALLADLFLMPVLIMTTKPFGAEFEPSKR